MSSQKLLNHRMARAYALVMTGSLTQDAEGHWHRAGKEYTICVESQTCTCPEFSKNAATAAAISKFEAELEQAPTAFQKQGLARLLGTLRDGFAGEGCKHLLGIAHLQGKIDLKALLGQLSKEPTPGFFKYDARGNKLWADVDVVDPTTAEVRKVSKPVLVSPYEDALALYRVERIASEKILAAQNRQEERVEHLDLRVPVLKVTGKGKYVLENPQKRLVSYWSYAWPVDDESHEFLKDQDAFALAKCVWDEAHYSFSKVMVDLAIASNYVAFC